MLNSNLITKLKGKKKKSKLIAKKNVNKLYKKKIKIIIKLFN